MDATARYAAQPRIPAKASTRRARTRRQYCSAAAAVKKRGPRPSAERPGRPSDYDTGWRPSRRALPAPAIGSPSFRRNGLRYRRFPWPLREVSGFPDHGPMSELARYKRAHPATLGWSRQCASRPGPRRPPLGPVAEAAPASRMSTTARRSACVVQSERASETRART